MGDKHSESQKPKTKGDVRSTNMEQQSSVSPNDAVLVIETTCEDVNFGESQDFDYSEIKLENIKAESTRIGSEAEGDETGIPVADTSLNSQEKEEFAMMDFTRIKIKQEPLEITTYEELEMEPSQTAINVIDIKIEQEDDNQQVEGDLQDDEEEEEEQLCYADTEIISVASSSSITLVQNVTTVEAATIDKTRDKMDTPRDKMDKPRDTMDKPRDKMDKPMVNMETPRDNIDTPRDKMDKAGNVDPPTVNTQTTSNASCKPNGETKSEKTGGRGLWITNLLPSTRATELKRLLSQYGKVIGAKVVSTRHHTRCYGYVTMDTKTAADICMEKLNKTRIKGQVIAVQRSRPDFRAPLKTPKKAEKRDSPRNTRPEKEELPLKNTDKPEKADEVLKEDKGQRNGKASMGDKSNKDDKAIKGDKAHKEDKGQRDDRPARKERSLSKSYKRNDRPTDPLTYGLTWEEEKATRRGREREREEEERRREEIRRREDEKHRREVQRVKEMEKRQRDEALRLEREREKLRVERERLDRQRAELMRLERERQRLERERLEQEKLELKRQQMRLEESCRPLKRSTNFTYRRSEGSFDDRKRSFGDILSPRYEARKARIETKKESDKERIPFSTKEYPSAERYPHVIPEPNNSNKYSAATESCRTRGREIHIAKREPSPPILPKKVKYEPRERSPVSYRKDRKSKNDPNQSRDHRYDETVSAIKESTRFRDNAWQSSGNIPPKQYGGLSGPTGSSSRDVWNKTNTWKPGTGDSGDRWIGPSSRIIPSTNPSPTIYSGHSGGNSSMPYTSSNISGQTTTDGDMYPWGNYKYNNPRKY